MSQKASLSPRVGLAQSGNVSRVIADLEPVGSRTIEPRLEEMRIEGRSVIPVYGYPLVTPPEHVVEAVREAATSTKSPSSAGLTSLREGLSSALEDQYGGALDPGSEILVTSGAMHGLHIVFHSLLEPGDEVVLITPCYFFTGLIRMTGAKVVLIPAGRSQNYAIDFDAIRAAITPRTKLLVLSSPVNPTGYVYSRQDVEEFLQIAEEHDLMVVSDESYDRMVFDGLEHLSPFHYLDARHRVILIKSFTKSYALPNWRVGYIAADSSLIPSLRKVLEWTMLYCPYVNQRAALAALTGPQDWLLRVVADLDARRKQLVAGLTSVPGYEWVEPRGGPFIFLGVCDENEDESKIADQLLEEFGVPAVAGARFHAPGSVRIPYGGEADAVKRLITALAEASKIAVQ